MLTPQQALEQLYSAAAGYAVQQTPEVINTLAANGRVLAQAIQSPMNVPAADNSPMDGYAVRSTELAAHPVGLFDISQRIPAGSVPQALQPGTVARVFTGAMIPAGADAVVMQEQTELVGNQVRFTHQPKSGEFIRRAGEDIQTGQIILEAGMRLTPQALGLAASVGQAQVKVAARLKVAVFFTGDELAMPGEPLKPGALYNSNRFVLRALLENLGCEVTDLGIVPDSLEATRSALRQAAQSSDLIITSGGVSVGEEDHIKPAVEAEGRLNLWQIAIKPGKPLAFGKVNKPAGAPAFFVGLPGNPVSSFVTFLMFVRPFILRLQGMPEAQCAPQALPMRAEFSWPPGNKIEKRTEFLRVQQQADGSLQRFTNQGSGVLTSTVWGSGLVENPSGNQIKPGDVVRYLPFAQLLY